jgi:hypothetical protein
MQVGSNLKPPRRIEGRRARGNIQSFGGLDILSCDGICLHCLQIDGFWGCNCKRLVQKACVSKRDVAHSSLTSGPNLNNSVASAELNLMQNFKPPLSLFSNAQFASTELETII